MKIVSKVIASGSFPVFMLVGSVVGAKDFPRTVMHIENSVTQAMSGATVPLLRRETRGTARSVAQALVANICGSSCANATVSNTSGRTRVATPEWELDVSAEGSVVRSRNVQVEAGAHAQGRPTSAAMPEAALESAGRSFIAAKLSSFIVLASGESLVPVVTGYRTEGGQDARGGAVYSAVVANRVVFARTIDGVPVVGGGSTVSITFNNAGAVEGFEYDWPSYARTGDSRLTLPSAQILQRLQEFIVASTEDSAAGPPTARKGQAYPVELTASSSLVRLECGHYDPGRWNERIASLVQPACVYHVVNTKNAAGTAVMAGLAGAVPAAQQVEPDAGWPEAAFVLQVPSTARSSSVRK